MVNLGLTIRERGALYVEEDLVVLVVSGRFLGYVVHQDEAEDLLSLWFYCLGCSTT